MMISCARFVSSSLSFSSDIDYARSTKGVVRGYDTWRVTGQPIIDPITSTIPNPRKSRPVVDLSPESPLGRVFSDQQQQRHAARLGLPRSGRSSFQVRNTPLSFYQTPATDFGSCCRPSSTSGGPRTAETWGSQQQHSTTARRLRSNTATRGTRETRWVTDWPYTKLVFASSTNALPMAEYCRGEASKSVSRPRVSGRAFASCILIAAAGDRWGWWHGAASSCSAFPGGTCAPSTSKTASIQYTGGYHLLPR
ncbi:hypothetical protein BHE74_00035347 [Ensete ventricosum]|nr:hypothetical protein BHE74_00035347 [Ensete ventricosum]